MTRPLALILLLVAPAIAADRPAPFRSAAEANRALGRGINLGNMLDAPTEGAWGLTLKDEYLDAIKAAGFDSVRIPVSWGGHRGPSPDYSIDPAFFERIDRAVDGALARGLVVVLNAHHEDALHVDPFKNLPALINTWRQVAARYKDRPDRLFFELLNEPHGEFTDGRWQGAFPTLLASVRGSNPDRIVIIGGGHWNSYDHLRALELPGNDRRLIATFHYYSPFEFTHQGAEWVAGSSAWKGTAWKGTDADRGAIRGDFAKAAAWAREQDRPLFLGEFGAYNAADPDDRARWTDFIAREAESLGFSWAYWEFGAGFGAYDPTAKAWRRPILDALIPPKAPRR